MEMYGGIMETPPHDLGPFARDRHVKHLDAAMQVSLPHACVTAGNHHGMPCPSFLQARRLTIDVPCSDAFARKLTTLCNSSRAFPGVVNCSAGSSQITASASAGMVQRPFSA